MNANMILDKIKEIGETPIPLKTVITIVAIAILISRPTTTYIHNYSH